jgi:hypothetical protein
LTDDPHIDASNIDVSVSSCEVVLTGTVDSRFAKRHAEDLAEAVSGVKNVENRLRVTNNSSNMGSGSSAYSGTSGTHNTGYSGSSGASPVGAFDTTKPE